MNFILLIHSRHPSLSDKISSPKVLTALNFQLDPTHSLELVLGAAMPGNRYEFLSIGAMTLSMGNSDAVRDIEEDTLNNNLI